MMVGSRPLGADTTSEETSQGDTMSLPLLLLDGKGMRLLSG